MVLSDIGGFNIQSNITRTRVGDSKTYMFGYHVEFITR